MKNFISLIVIALGLVCGIGSTHGYAQCGSPSVLAKWDFNSKTVQCNGATAKPKDLLTPTFSKNVYTYCPNVNNGCGAGLLGSVGFLNSTAFANGLCLSNFYNSTYIKSVGGAAYDPASTTFNPDAPINLKITYKSTIGKAGCLSDFSLTVLQKQFNGSTVNFEKQAVAVKRNGVVVYNQMQNILASNVNGTPLTFTFTGDDFCWDGSTEVTFEIVFGLVKQLTKQDFPGSPSTTGYDDITLKGTCGSSPTSVATIAAATCTGSNVNSDGKITLSNFGATDKYDYTTGSTYTGSKTYATATTIPAGGVIVNNLANPVSSTVYTVRVFTSTGCTTDLNVTLTPTTCAQPSCTAPTALVTSTLATCNGTSPNYDASIVVSNVSNGDKVALSLGTAYTGVGYASANTLTGGAFTFTNLANPITSQNYVVRVFNGNTACFHDYAVVVNEKDCGCKRIAVQIKSSDQADPNSTPNNGNTSEDDFATYEVCKDTSYIDLKLTEVVAPNSGTTCPVNTPFVWTLTLTNEGTMTATDIQVANNLPEDLKIISSTTTSGTFGANTGWLVSSLAPNSSTTLTITTIAPKAGTFQTCAWVNGAAPLNDIDSSPDNDYTANEDDDDCASITVTGPNVPTIAKEFSPMAAKPGTPIRLTLKITNNETTPITLTSTFADYLPSSPAAMTISATPNVNVNNGVPVIAAAGSNLIFIPNGTTLPVGTTQIQVDVIAPAEGTYCNVILPNALQTSSCSNIDTVQACVLLKSDFVAAPLIKKSFLPAMVETNQNSVLTITIENRNDNPITLLQDLKDYLPAGLVLAGAASGTCTTISTFGSTDEVGLTSGSVLAPGSCTISVPVKSTTAGDYCNRIPMNALVGQVSNGSIMVMSGNEDVAEACLKVVPDPIFDLALRKTLAAGQDSIVSLGATVNYNIRVFNQGTVDATAVQITDYIPTGMSLSASSQWTVTGSKATLVTPLPLLKAGHDTTLTISLKVENNATSELINRAEVSAASGGTDIDSTPDDDSTNDTGGKARTPSDDTIFGNGTGAPNDTNGLTDEDDADPAAVRVGNICEAAKMAVGVVLAPQSIRTQNDIITVTFGVVNNGPTPLSNVTFEGSYKLFKGSVGAPTVLSVTKSGDVNNDGIMQPQEAWLFTATLTNLPYRPGDVFLVCGLAKALCGTDTVKAGGADLLFTAGVNMDVEISNDCIKPGELIDVNLIARLLIDEDVALNPGTITVGETVITLPKRRFEARNMRITSPLLNGGVAFDPFNPPVGLTIETVADQGGADGGRNTSNILDESEPVNTARKPCSALGQNDANCDFPDWVFKVKIQVPVNYTGDSFIVEAADQFDLYEAIEDPAGSGTYTAFSSLGIATESDKDTVSIKPNAGSDQTLVCTDGSLPATLQLVATPAGGSWGAKAGNPAGMSINNSGLVTITNATAQGKSFEFVYTLNGCTDTLSITAPVCAPACTKPVAIASPKTQTICVGSPAIAYVATPSSGVEYKWYGPLADTTTSFGTAIVGQTTASFTPTGTAISIAGTKYFAVIVNTTGNTACSDTAFVKLVVNAKPTPINFTPASICIGLGVTYPNPSGTTGTWTGPGVTDNGTGATVSTTNAMTQLSATPPKTFYIYYTQSSNGCTQVDSAEILVKPRPIVTITGPTATGATVICKDELPVSFTATPTGGTFDIPQGLPVGAVTHSGNVLTLNPGHNIASLTFSYSYTDSGTECTGTDSHTVTVNPKPNAGSNQAPSCVGTTPITTVNLAATATTGGIWSQVVSNPSGATITTPSSATSSVTGLNPGTYRFVWTAATGCADTVQITIPNCVKGSLGDYVWKDVNDNGIQGDAEDTPVQGVILELYKNGLATGIKDTTDSNGKYLFTIADSARYQVKILTSSLPAGCLISSKQNVGADDKDSDFDPATGLSDEVTVNPLNPAKRNVLTVDAALVTPCTAPVWTITSSPQCAPNQQTYSVTFTITGKNGTLKANGMVLTGGNPYTVSVASGVNIILTDSLSSVCRFDTTIVAPFCGCPISEPVAIAPSVSVCEGEALPPLVVTVATGATANWYATQTGGVALASNTLTYQPTKAGTYWVEAVVEGGQGCVSVRRTPVSLIIIPNNCIPFVIRKLKK